MSTIGTGSTPGSAASGGPVVPGSAGPTGGAGGGRRGAGTVADMLRSLVVCGALVAVVVLLFFTSSSGDHPPKADVAAATTQAVAAGLPVSTPRLPQGWTATSARYAPDTTEGLPTWHAGYLTPSGTDASADVTTGATPAWTDGVVGGQVEEPGQTSEPTSQAGSGSRIVGGTRWQTRTLAVDGRTVRVLIRTDGAVTEVVSGHATWEQLQVLAARLS